MYWRLTVCVICLLASFPSKASEQICLKGVSVQISAIHPPVHLASEISRKAEIWLRQRIDCRTGRPLIPSSVDEALDWLDVALPLDFKQGMVKGEYLKPYVFTSYGASVEEDLFDYFSKSWNLNSDFTICKDKNVAKRMSDEEIGCFSVLLDRLRDTYLPGPKDQ